MKDKIPFSYAVAKTRGFRRSSGTDYINELKERKKCCHKIDSFPANFQETSF